MRLTRPGATHTPSGWASASCRNAATASNSRVRRARIDANSAHVEFTRARFGPYVMHRADGARTRMDDCNRRRYRVAVGDSGEIALHPAARPLAGRAAPLPFQRVIAGHKTPISAAQPCPEAPRG